MDATTTVEVPTLSRAVSRRRVELGLTQKDLAERSGVSVATLSAIERGARSAISIGTCNRLDAALDWEEGTTNRLATEEPSNEELADLLRALLLDAGFIQHPRYSTVLRKLTTLSDDHVRDVERYIDKLAR